MRPERRNYGRPAIPVISRIIDMLHAWRNVNPAPDVRGVIRLENIFAPVIQIPIAQQKTQASQPQLLLMVLANSIRDNRHASTVLPAMPERSSSP